MSIANCRLPIGFGWIKPSSRGEECDWGDDLVVQVGNRQLAIGNTFNRQLATGNNDESTERS